MSHVLYRLGRFAARRRWAVIGAWLDRGGRGDRRVGIVRARARRLGRRARPRLPGGRRTALAAPSSDDAGLTAYVVATPLDDGETFFDSAAARAELAERPGGDRRRSPTCSASPTRPARWPQGRDAAVAERIGLTRRPGRAAPGAVPGPRGAGLERPRPLKASVARGPRRLRRSRSRWAATCSSPSSSPRRAPARSSAWSPRS